VIAAFAYGSPVQRTAATRKGTFSRYACRPVDPGYSTIAASYPARLSSRRHGPEHPASFETILVARFKGTLRDRPIAPIARLLRQPRGFWALMEFY